MEIEIVINYLLKFTHSQIKFINQNKQTNFTNSMESFLERINNYNLKKFANTIMMAMTFHSLFQRT